MEDREYCIRMDVCRKRSLYTRLVIFAFMSVFSIVIWLITGMGMFWPIWVMAAFILTIFVESLQICSFRCVRRWFNFLTPEWECNEVNRCLNVNCYVSCNSSSTNTNTTTATQTTVASPPTNVAAPSIPAAPAAPQPTV
jgi:hypothetical protein